MNLFNERAIVVLYFSDKKLTAVFFNAATQLWNCLNFKTKDGWVLLNDKNGRIIQLYR